MFRTCKRILQDSGTFKQVSWGLDVGTRVWPNQYKSEFALSSLNLLYLLLLYIHIQIVLFESIFKKIVIKGIHNLIKKCNRFLIGEVVWNI